MCLYLRISDGFGKSETEENGLGLSSDSEHESRLFVDRIAQGQQETDAEHCRALKVQTQGGELRGLSMIMLQEAAESFLTNHLAFGPS